MPLITQGKTNWKFLLIVFFLAAVVCGGVYYVQENIIKTNVLSTNSPAGGYNKSCSIDDDCKYNCGCGAINKNETCHYQGAYDCVRTKAKCESGICVAEDKSIRVISPNGGEQWTVRKTYAINWYATGIDYVDIIYKDIDSGVEIGRIETMPASFGSYYWLIPARGVFARPEFTQGRFQIIIKENPVDPDTGEEISDLSDSSFTITQSDDTISWKTYRNNKYKYEFQYPDFWTIGYDIDPGASTLEDEIGLDAIYIDIDSDNDADSRRDDCVDYVLGNNFHCESTTTADNLPVVINWNDGDWGDYDGEAFIAIPHQDSYVTLNLIDGQNAEYKSIFYQMLSTFRFIEEDETADWQTYRNEEYGFEFQYPPNCLITVETENERRNIKRENEELYIEFSGSTPEDFDICTGGFSVRKNKKQLPLKEWLLDLYDFPQLKFEEIKTPAEIIALRIPPEQSKEFDEKFGGYPWIEAPEEIEYEYLPATHYWITGNKNWIFSLFHFQDGGLLDEEMLSTFKFLE